MGSAYNTIDWTPYYGSKLKSVYDKLPSSKKYPYFHVDDDNCGVSHIEGRVVWNGHHMLNIHKPVLQFEINNEIQPPTVKFAYDQSNSNHIKFVFKASNGHHSNAIDFDLKICGDEIISANENATVLNVQQNETDIDGNP